MNILITGGAGFIGSHVVEHHLKRGDEVVAVDDLSTGSRANLEEFQGNPRFRFVEAVAVPDEQRAPDDLLCRAQTALHAARGKGGDTCVGGSAAGSSQAQFPKGPLAHLRDLLPKRSKDPDLKRRTD